MKIQEFDYTIDVLEALLWRHNDAVNLQALMEFKNSAVDDLNNDFWTDWYNDVFNLQTANRFGLSVWSIILQIPLSISGGQDEPPNSNFGFGAFRKNFNNGNFTSVGNENELTVEQARLVLKLRFYQLVTRATVPECNKIVNELFGDLGDVYVLDGLNMTMTYVFQFYLPAPIRQVIDEYDILPRPAGVLLNTIEVPNQNFGFGQFRKNFNNGNFRR